MCKVYIKVSLHLLLGVSLWSASRCTVARRWDHQMKLKCTDLLFGYVTTLHALSETLLGNGSRCGNVMFREHFPVFAGAAPLPARPEADGRSDLGSRVHIRFTLTCGCAVRLDPVCTAPGPGS
jgi:hypothetical protein